MEEFKEHKTKEYIRKRNDLESQLLGLHQARIMAPREWKKWDKWEKELINDLDTLNIFYGRER